MSDHIVEIIVAIGSILMIAFFVAGEVGKERAQAEVAIACIKVGGEWVADKKPPYGCLRPKKDQP